MEYVPRLPAALCSSPWSLGRGTQKLLSRRSAQGEAGWNLHLWLRCQWKLLEDYRIRMVLHIRLRPLQTPDGLLSEGRLQRCAPDRWTITEQRFGKGSAGHAEHAASTECVLLYCPASNLMYCAKQRIPCTSILSAWNSSVLQITAAAGLCSVLGPGPLSRSMDLLTFYWRFLFDKE